MASPEKPKLTEVDLARHIARYFSDLHWDVYQEVQLMQGGPRADLVVTQGKLVGIVECKHGQPARVDREREGSGREPRPVRRAPAAPDRSGTGCARKSVTPGKGSYIPSVYRTMESLLDLTLAAIRVAAHESAISKDEASAATAWLTAMARRDRAVRVLDALALHTGTHTPAPELHGISYYVPLPTLNRDVTGDTPDAACHAAAEAAWPELPESERLRIGECP